MSARWHRAKVSRPMPPTPEFRLVVSRKGSPQRLSLEPIPTAVIVHPNPAMLGLAALLADRSRRHRTG